MIYFLEGHTTFQAVLSELFYFNDKGGFVFITSTITLLEVLVKPIREGRTDIAKQYRQILTNAPGMILLDVTTPIAARAATLRAQYQLKTPDAIQLAAAMEAGADCFLTNDKSLKKVSEIPTLSLDELT